jgi:hypothetical protein
MDEPKSAGDSIFSFLVFSFFNFYLYRNCELQGSNLTFDIAIINEICLDLLGQTLGILRYYHVRKNE